MTSENREKTVNFFKILNPRPLDYESAELAGKLFATTLKDNTIGWRDTYIGAITLLNGKTIITSNKKHFERISELKTIEYY
jgi:predicted nucleic acid-binding protein